MKIKAVKIPDLIAALRSIQETAPASAELEIALSLVRKAKVRPVAGNKLKSPPKYIDILSRL